MKPLIVFLQHKTVDNNYDRSLDVFSIQVHTHPAISKHIEQLVS